MVYFWLRYHDSFLPYLWHKVVNVYKRFRTEWNYFRKIRKVAYVKGNSVFQHLLFVISQFLTNQMSNTTATESEPKGKMDFDSDFGVDQNKSLRRPWVAFFHFFFRITALVVYLFGSTFSGSFIGVFVTVILLLSLDFWTVKNISGRILVWTSFYFVLLKVRTFESKLWFPQFFQKTNEAH